MRNQDIYFHFLGQDLYLLPQKAIYWANRRALLLSDLHLGKVNHFRKAGIAVPGTTLYHDYQVLDELLADFQVKELLILGDLFHSALNTEWTYFGNWLAGYPELKITLVKGNHDILPDNLYQSQRIFLYQEILEMAPFCFSHIPLEPGSTQLYNLSGHIHPAVKLRGAGAQQLTLPCFYFGKNSGLLPAFGYFTGKAVIRPDRESRLFIITDQRVLSL